MNFGEEVHWRSENRSFSMIPVGHLWRFVETRNERDRKTGEMVEKSFDLSLIPGGIYVEVCRLLELAAER